MGHEVLKVRRHEPRERSQVIGAGVVVARDIVRVENKMSILVWMGFFIRRALVQKEIKSQIYLLNLLVGRGKSLSHFGRYDFVGG